MNDQHHQCLQQADADHALLAVILAPILEQHQRPGKHLFRVGKIETVLAQVGLTFGCVPEIAHGLILHIRIHISSLGAFEVQRQQAAEDFVVGHFGGVVGSAVGGGDGLVEGLVGEG